MRKGVVTLIFLLYTSLTQAADTAVILFVDSAEPRQAELVEDINRALFYSAELREKLTVQVFDINPRARAFRGEIIYRKDLQGHAVAQYRPGDLPYVFCQFKGKTVNHFTVTSKEQLCL